MHGERTGFSPPNFRRLGASNSVPGPRTSAGLETPEASHFSESCHPQRCPLDSSLRWTRNRTFFAFLTASPTLLKSPPAALCPCLTPALGLCWLKQLRDTIHAARVSDDYSARREYGIRNFAVLHGYRLCSIGTLWWFLYCGDEERQRYSRFFSRSWEPVNEPVHTITETKWAWCSFFGVVRLESRNFAMMAFEELF